jgi:hypothetical protein
MKKGTEIKYNGTLYNEDGDHPVDLGKRTKAFTQEEIKEAYEDPELKFMLVGQDRIFGIDKLKLDDEYFLLLEPNPVTFYFSLAFDSVQQIAATRKNLKKILKNSSNDGSKAQAFSFLFRVCAVCTTFSFLALEAFLNQMLPDTSLIEFKGKMVSKKTVEKEAYFNDKFNNIIPAILNKNFAEDFPADAAVIMQLKKMRDKLIHLKEVRDGFTSYNKIYQEILDTNFQQVVNCIKKCINFYRPNLIVTYGLKTQIK